jgi:transposase-like protein
VPAPKRRYSKAFREKAVATYRQSQPASYRAVAADVGVHLETLRTWVHAAGRDPDRVIVSAPVDAGREVELRLQREVDVLRTEKAALLEALRVCLNQAASA